MSNRRTTNIDEFTHMSKEDLEIAISELEKVYEESRRQRNHTQQERDIAENFANYVVEKREQWKKNVIIKEDEFQENEVEQKLSLLNSKQRLVYLEFEKEKNLKELEIVAKQMEEQEKEIHQEKMNEYNNKKKEVKQLMEMQKNNNIREVR
jgi:hypothetical protein